jgi:hypothetical protein
MPPHFLLPDPRVAFASPTIGLAGLPPYETRVTIDRAATTHDFDVPAKSIPIPRPAEGPQ